MAKTFERESERTVPVVEQPSFDASTLTRATPMPDRLDPILFDPADAAAAGRTSATVSAAGESRRA